MSQSMLVNPVKIDSHILSCSEIFTYFYSVQYFPKLLKIKTYEVYYQ